MTTKEIIDGLENLAEFLESKSGDGPDSIFNSGFFEDDIKILQEAVQKLQENQSFKSGWSSVADVPPDIGKLVIVARPNRDGGVRVEQGCRCYDGTWKVSGTRAKNVTHWMPFPDPPEKGTT